MTGEVDKTHQVVYRQVLPVLVCLGILANGLCIVVLSRPRLRSAWVIRYFMVLAVSDLLVCVFYIPIITTINGCVFSSYNEARYFAHFGWSLVTFSQSVGTYVIVWLAMDRFMAVWTPRLYPRIQKMPKFMWIRIVVTVVLCFLIHLEYMVHVKISCVNDIDVIWTNETCPSHNNTLSNDVNCLNNTWVVTDAYHYMYKKNWHEIVRIFYALMVRWLPCSLMLVFNASLVVGVVKQRIRFPATKKRRSGEKALAIITIAMTASYIILTLPITIYLTYYAELLPNRCHCDYPYELFRHIGNTLQLLEHVLHILFLVTLNHKFRRELKILLHLEVRTKEGDYSTRDEGGAEIGSNLG
ncbi:probable G-protein coupled receptor B0563.6 isoform X2 [Procambarus clarkii]|nr:cholecystokinin receptor type A-like isoform X2 [Procambarus clarkii]